MTVNGELTLTHTQTHTIKPTSLKEICIWGERGITLGGGVGEKAPAGM